MALSKRELFQKRRLRNRNKIKAMANGRPRLSVHRSNKNISVQLIDDVEGKTLASASSLESALGVVGKNNVEAAAKVGAAIAERAKKAGVEECSSTVAVFCSTAASRRWPMPPVRVV
jgi:large subunit ribosomal protein L18